jgi:uncharacterized protein (TIGR02145 family)
MKKNSLLLISFLIIVLVKAQHVGIAIANPAVGLLVYCTDCANGEMQYYNGTNWMKMTVSSLSFLPSVKICIQIWKTKNLDVSTYRNGDSIPQVTNATQWSGLTTGAWCYYNNDSVMGAIYGKLYNWYAVNDPRGLAPIGWHVPSDAEWTTVSTCLGDSAVAGAMKETGTTHWLSPNVVGTYNSGFAALPGGYRSFDGVYSSPNGSVSYLWSSTEMINPVYAWCRSILYNDAGLMKGSLNKPCGFSVRCVRD